MASASLIHDNVSCNESDCGYDKFNQNDMAYKRLCVSCNSLARICFQTPMNIYYTDQQVAQIQPILALFHKHYLDKTQRIGVFGNAGALDLQTHFLKIIYLLKNGKAGGDQVDGVKKSLQPLKDALFVGITATAKALLETLIKIAVGIIQQQL